MCGEALGKSIVVVLASRETRSVFREAPSKSIVPVSPRGEALGKSIVPMSLRGEALGKSIVRNDRLAGDASPHPETLSAERDGNDRLAEQRFALLGGRSVSRHGNDRLAETLHEFLGALSLFAETRYALPSTIFPQFFRRFTERHGRGLEQGHEQESASRR